MIVAPYEACVAGDLAFPPGAVATWRALPLDVDAFSDWPESFALGGDDDSTAMTIGQWLDECARYERSGPRHFLEFAVDACTLRLRGFLEESEYSAYRRPLATMFRQAGLVGARGALAFVSKPWGRFVFAYRVDVTPERSHIVALDETEARALPERAAIDAIAARVRTIADENGVTERATSPRL